MREQQQEKAQIESARHDMLVYKQMVYALKGVLKNEKDKKVKKALIMEIRANEDIIQTMIRLGFPDVPLPLEIKLQITVEKGKTAHKQDQSHPERDHRL